MQKRTILTILGIVIIAVGAWYLLSLDTSAPATTGDIVAVVNEEEISRADFETLHAQVVTQQGIDITSLDAEMQKQLEDQVVDELIVQALLRQAVEVSEVTITQEEIDTRMDAIVAQLGGEEAFQQALDVEGLSEEALRSEVRTELASQTYLEQELNLASVSVSEEEIQTTYEQLAAQDETVPQLAEIRDQVEELVIQQKQQDLFAQHIAQLRAQANVEILL